MNKKQKKTAHLEKISFANLVKAIDNKWSHTYITATNE